MKSHFLNRSRVSLGGDSKACSSQRAQARPRNLDIQSILSYQLPLPGIASIIHRISGVIVFLMIPVIAWLLDSSLSSPESFLELQRCLDHFLVKLFLWGFLGALAYHLVAGIKHLVMDFGHAETLAGAMIASRVTFACAAVLFVVLGVWIW